MSRIYNYKGFLKYLVLFVLFTILPLVEGQFSNLMSSFFSGIVISTHLVILLMFFFLRFLNHRLVYFFIIWCGIVTDFYFYKTIFLTLIAYIVVLLIIDNFNTINKNSVLRSILTFIISCFIFDVIVYGIAYSFNMTNENLVYFVTFNLTPSFIFNLILSLLFIPLFNHE
jgi:rod shape-determining protein MreD